MKTFAHISADGSIVGIGMIYMESGGFTPGVAEFVNRLGEHAGIVAYGESVLSNPAHTTVLVDTQNMPGENPDGWDKTFRGAFHYAGAGVVAVDMPEAKLIAHDMRRAKRAVEFVPLDIESTIPSKSSQAEAARQVIREKYSAIQSQIDAAADIDAIKAALGAM